MSNVKNEAVRLIADMVNSPDKVVRMFLVVDGDHFLATVNVGGKERKLDLNAGSFVVMMIAPDATKGLAPGLYDPEYVAKPAEVAR